MKPLIVTIVIAILAISLTGCTFVREYHRGHASHEVIVTQPRHLPIVPGNPRYHVGHHAPPPMPRRDRHRF